MSGTLYGPTLWHASARQDTFADLEDHLARADHDRLAAVAANTVLNDWCGDIADIRETHEKRLPYIGWYWRSVDFARRSITVGDCGEFIGFMENNKWDYPERDLTTEEADHVIDLLWRARKAGSVGGLLSDAHDARDALLAELWGWMQDLTGLKGWGE